MKTKLLLIAFSIGVCLRASAGELIDGANLFGPDLDAVRTAVADSSVWIETRVDVPVGGLKEYADMQAQGAMSRGYYVVISTQPREWRISMNPQSLASPEAVRSAGERMVARFRAGQYRDGAIALVRELEVLPPPSPAAAFPAAKPRPVYRSLNLAPSPFVPQRTFGGGVFVLFFAAIAGGVILIILFGQKTRRDAAQRLFDSYTPAQRAELVQRHADRNTAYPSAMTDPLVFWAMMSSIASSQNSSSDDTWRHVTPPDTFSSPSPSTFDSGSSSPPPSSSDSSGAGGSW